MAAATYLDTPIDKEVTMEDVFAGTVAKLRSLVDQYLPLKRLYTVQNRKLRLDAEFTPVASVFQDNSCRARRGRVDIPCLGGPTFWGTTISSRPRRKGASANP